MYYANDIFRKSVIVINIYISRECISLEREREREYPLSIINAIGNVKACNFSYSHTFIHNVSILQEVFAWDKYVAM